mgnify:CR=1 FL=1
MVEYIKELPEICVDNLMAVEGKKLELMANIRHHSMVEMMMESYLYGESGLNSPFVREYNEMILRLSVGFDGRGRTDVVDIGKAPRFVNNDTFGRD